MEERGIVLVARVCVCGGCGGVGVCMVCVQTSLQRQKPWHAACIWGLIHKLDMNTIKADSKNLDSSTC